MFLKAKSIILKAFPTCGSNFSSITFRLHFLHIFAIAKTQSTSQKSPKRTRASEKTAKTLARIRQNWQK